jgi:hypothetical protein
MAGWFACTSWWGWTTTAPPLRGCGDDVNSAARLLREQTGTAARLAARSCATPRQPCHLRTHVALAACREYQPAHAVMRAGRMRGVFSLALLNELRRPGRVPTYLELIAGARCYVENLFPRQASALYPVDRAVAGSALPERERAAGDRVPAARHHGGDRPGAR